MQIHHKSSVSGIKVFCSAFSPAGFLQREPAEFSSFACSQTTLGCKDVAVWSRAAAHTQIQFTTERLMLAHKVIYRLVSARSAVPLQRKLIQTVFLNLTCIKKCKELIRTTKCKCIFPTCWSSACCSVFSGLTVFYFFNKQTFVILMRNVCILPSLIFFRWSENMKTLSFSWRTEDCRL